MRILVIGGKGYIGSKLVPVLEGMRHEVSVFDLPDDIRDEKKLFQACNDKQAIVHLAAVFTEEYNQALQINTLSARNAAFFAATRDVTRFIFASTCGVLNKRDTTYYTKSKMNAELMIKCVNGSTAILRFGTVYGAAPVMNWKPLVNDFVKAAIEKKSLEVRSPMAFRPLVHIDDAIQSICLALEMPWYRFSNQTFNVASEIKRKGEIAEVVSQETGAGVQCTEGDDKGYVVTTSLELAEMGFKPRINLRQGVKELVSAHILQPS